MFRKRYASHSYLVAGVSALLALGACGEGPSKPEARISAVTPAGSASVATKQPDDRTLAQPPGSGTNAIDIGSWDQAELRGGYSANRLIGTDVRGKGGNSIGKIEDLLVDADGNAIAIVVESGGFLDIGDKHFRVPWGDAKLAADLEHVVVPLSKESAAQYRDTRDREKVRTGPREYRMSELKNDNVTLADGARYGVVDDLILGRDGKVNAIVVNAVRDATRYAYPYRSGAYIADTNGYALPYQQTQINNLKPFDYRAASIVEPRMSATGAASGSAGEGSAGSEQRDRQRRPSKQSKG